MRLDKWLWAARFYKSRSLAQTACDGGKVDVNGQAAKPHRELRTGDVIDITRPRGARQRVLVKAVADRHLPKAQARLLYEDTTPPPTADEQALRDLLRLAGPRRVVLDAPDRRERRRLRRLKEGEV
jgi:ribosome-associated heat shock protein Hsp15